MMMMMNVANAVRGALNGVLIYFGPDIPFCLPAVWYKAFS